MSSISTTVPSASPAPAPFALLPPNILEVLRWEAIFGNSHPVALDLGAGDGGFALAYARARPDLNLVAVERLLGRVRKIARRAERGELRNLRVLRLESSYVVERLCAPGSVSEIHLLFPDPWPKRRHWERRLLQVPFLQLAAQALRPGGAFRFVTDYAEYFQHGLEVFAQSPQFIRVEEDPALPYPPTDFERGFRAEGKPIHGGVWRKRA